MNKKFLLFILLVISVCLIPAAASAVESGEDTEKPVIQKYLYDLQNDTDIIPEDTDEGTGSNIELDRYKIIARGFSFEDEGYYGESVFLDGQFDPENIRFVETISDNSDISVNFSWGEWVEGGLVSGGDSSGTAHILIRVHEYYSDDYDWVTEIPCDVAWICEIPELKYPTIVLSLTGKGIDNPFLNLPSGFETDQWTKWESTNKKVAVVDKHCHVKPVGQGHCRIEAEFAGLAVGFEVEVRPQNKMPHYEFPTVLLSTKDKGIWNDIINWPEDEDGYLFGYDIISSNKSVAWGDGFIYPKKPGICTMTADIGGYKFSHKVIVVDPSKLPSFKNASYMCFAGSKAFTNPISNVPSGLNVKWSSSNTGIASVSQKGAVTPKKAGSCTIRAKIAQKTFTYKLYVANSKKKPAFAYSQLLFVVGDKAYGNKLSNVPKGIKVTWSSSNGKIATVNKAGTVTPKKVGSCTIRAKVAQKTYSYKVTVVSKKKKPQFDIPFGVGPVGEHDKNPLLNIPKGMKVTWSTSNKKVATVNKNGVVTFKKKGACMIRAKVAQKTYSYKLTVMWIPNYYANITKFSKKNKYVSMRVKNNGKKAIKIKTTNATLWYDNQKQSRNLVGKTITIKPKKTKTIVFRIKGGKVKKLGKDPYIYYQVVCDNKTYDAWASKKAKDSEYEFRFGKLKRVIPTYY